MTTNLDNIEDLKILIPNQFDIACEFHKLFKDMYKTSITKIRTVTWFIYKNEKWEKEEKHNIFNKIRLELTNLFEQKMLTHNTTTKKNIEKILNKLKNDNYIKNIMRELVELFL